MRRVILLLLLFLVLGLNGCLISEQVGERTHVNSPPPDELTFHFDTLYNKIMLFGRSGALLLVGLWAFSSSGKGGGKTTGLIIVVAALAGSGWLLKTGWSTVFDYRIEVRNEGLELRIPSQPQQDIGWREIEGIEGEGKATDVSIPGGGGGHTLKWATQWESLTITLDDGRTRNVDLRPLSVEQRGILWRAIARKASLSVNEWVEPAGR